MLSIRIQVIVPVIVSIVIVGMSPLDALADLVTDTITVGDFPVGIAYDSANGRMYVTNEIDDTVSVISTSSNTVTDTITVGINPLGIAYDSANGRMYVTNASDDTVSVITIQDPVEPPNIAPNLVVSSMTHLPASPHTDDLMTFTATVTNQGTAPASATTLMFKIGGETAGGPDTLFDIPALDPGASSVPVERILTLDVAQNYRNTATADYFNVVGESNEADNTLTDNFTVTEGGCLIATAAYGSHLAPLVQSLREFRDNEVMQTESGKFFIDTVHKYYYTFAPTIADWELENPAFKEAVRLFITPALYVISVSNYVDIDSENEMISYLIGMISLNIGMYFVAPAIVVSKISQRFRK